MTNKYRLELWLVIGLYMVAIISGLTIFQKFRKLDDSITSISSSIKANTETVGSLERKIREESTKH